MDFEPKTINFPLMIEAKKPRNREPVANYLTLHDSLRFGHDKIKLVKCSREWSQLVVDRCSGLFGPLVKWSGRSK